MVAHLLAAAAAAAVTLPLTRHPHRGTQPPGWKRWAAGGPVDLPVEGNYAPFGVFYTQLELGTPLRTYNVAIDTGSYRTIVTDASCSSCNDTSKRAYQGYSAAGSSTSARKTTFSNSYKTCDLAHPSRTCTIRGTVYSDHFRFGAAGGGTLNFGSITSQTGNFVQFESIHGLMGTDSLEGTDNFGGGTPIMAVSGGANVYAMCFQNNGHGKLTVGGTDPGLHSAPFQYTPLVFDISLSVAVQGMSVGGTKVQMAATEATLDSGTTLLLLPGRLFSAFRTALTAAHPAAEALFSGTCAPLSAPAAFPPFEMQLDGATLQVPPDSYLLPCGSGSYSLGVTNMGTGPSAMFIIGDTVMSQYYVVYDRKQKRVGWAPVNEQACFA